MIDAESGNLLTFMQPGVNFDEISMIICELGKKKKFLCLWLLKVIIATEREIKPFFGIENQFFILTLTMNNIQIINMHTNIKFLKILCKSK